MKNQYIVMWMFSLMSCFAYAQEYDSSTEEEWVYETFGDRRIINTHSIETLPARKLDFRIAHRFGDLAGDAGGWPTFYGLENAADVMIGFEYGFSNNLMFGINRTKGAGPLKQLINSFAKYKVISQGSKYPLSFSVMGQVTTSTMKKSETEGVLHFFESGAHRWMYHVGTYAARKFSERFSAQLSASYTTRNIVPAEDNNDLISIGVATRAQVTKSIGVILDTVFPLSSYRTATNGFYPILGLGIEFNTSGGHVFQMNFTNVKGLTETDYIPYSQSNIGDGEFRLGFTISRLFNL